MKTTTRVLLLVPLLFLLNCNKWQRNGALARMGNRRAMYDYGYELWIHTTGRQDEVDEALYWMTKAAEKGELDAMHKVGLINGSKGGVEWFRKGAELGDVRCMVSLAEAYGWGSMGLRQDHALAMFWIQKAGAADRKNQEEERKKYKPGRAPS